MWKQKHQHGRSNLNQSFQWYKKLLSINLISNLPKILPLCILILPHPFRYAESWMVLPGSTSLLYKQIQRGLHPTHVHDVMTWQCCNFFGWRCSNCHGNKRVLQQDDLFFHMRPTQSAFSNRMMISQTHLVIHQNDPFKTRSEGKGKG